MNDLEQKINKFATNPDNITEALSLMTVGQRMKASPEHIARTVIANVLLRFHGVPIEDSSRN